MQIFDHRGNAMDVRNVAALETKVSRQDGDMELLKERLAELELELEDEGWRQLVANGDREFSLAALRRIVRMSRLMYLKNPLIRQGCNVQARYVFGRGVTVTGREPQINDVVQAFWDDPKNKAELTSHEARMKKEVALQVYGNIFFVFFTDAISTGSVKLRTIPVEEISEIITNPEDRREPWYYKRMYTRVQYEDQSAAPTTDTVTEYLPDWAYQPAEKKPTLMGHTIRWELPVYHVKVGSLDDQLMGIPETYPALDHAKAYVQFLEDWCSITRAYARFAWNMQVKGGKRGVDAANKFFATTLATGNNQESIDRNPPPDVAAMFIGGDETTITPIKTSGATTSADDGRRVLLMVAAAMGLPETFFGDVSVGTLATATSLDRPTELKFLDRQTLWAEVIRRILDYAIDRAIGMTNSPLAGVNVKKKSAATDLVALNSDPESGEEIDRYVDVVFPALLEHDTLARIQAITTAANLGGYPLAGVLDLKTVTRLCLNELGVEDIDTLLDEMYPEGEPIPTGKPLPDADVHAIAKRPPPSAIAIAPGADPNDPDDPKAAIAATEASRAQLTHAFTQLKGAITKMAVNLDRHRRS